MAVARDKTHLNLSSVTTSDPSSQSLHSKKVKCSISAIRSPKKIPKNTPRSTDSFNLLHGFPSLSSLSIPANISPSHIEEINDFKQQKIKEYKEALESCLNASIPVNAK